MSLAYLLARIADTIADTEHIPASERLNILDRWAKAVASQGSDPIKLWNLSEPASNSPETILLQHAGVILRMLQILGKVDQALIQWVIGTIVTGQLLDLRRFQGGSVDDLTCLTSEDELQDYTYRVAGCVGEFWTRLCFRHLPSQSTAPSEQSIRQAVRFGQGLQLVNILRDVSADRLNGRCYLPSESFERFGLTVKDWQPGCSRLQPLYQFYVDQAREHLIAGWDYTTQLPFSWLRVRLACAWPILIGLDTLKALPTDDPLDAERKAKIPRRRVRAHMARSVMCLPFPFLWKRMVTISGVHGRK